jgi:predicted MFS family arabinose efflux permease
MFVGIGLARFAYAPLMPAIVAAGWFGGDEAAYLGAANLVGYLAGALTGVELARRMGLRGAARMLMLVTALSFVACATPVSFAWFLAWRFAAGVTGGALMVVAAPGALRLVPPARRGLASGLVFSGVGLGIIASGTLTPVLLARGLGTAWIAFAGIAFLVTLATWRAWPADPPAVVIAAPSAPQWPVAATAVTAAYGLIAAGLVPHMVFLPDYVARGLDGGIAAGAALWALFGIGATVGPPAAGAAADRIGFARALSAALVLETMAVALLLVSASPVALATSAIAVGAFVPGCVPLAIGRLHGIITEPMRQQTAWSRATAVFAIGQAAGAWLMSAAFAQGSGHRALFGTGAAAFLAALVLNLLAATTARRGSR